MSDIDIVAAEERERRTMEHEELIDCHKCGYTHREGYNCAAAVSASVSNDLLGHLPKHKCGLHLQHNDHKNVYEPAGQWIADNDWCDWENEEAKQRAIDTDEIWTIQWYPDTPVGFYALAAPTLDELLKRANKP